MKKTILLFYFTLVIVSSKAQVLNPSFEVWGNGYPDGWITSAVDNSATALQSTDAHGGNFALQLQIANDSNGVATTAYAITNFPLTTMPQVLSFWVKGNLSGSNYLNASFLLSEHDTTILAYGEQNYLNNISPVYQYKFYNILPYGSPSLLGQAQISFFINTPFNTSLETTTTVTIDDLYLGADNTALHENNNDSGIVQAFPNPTQDFCFLIFNQPQSGKAVIKVFDFLGHEVAEPLNEYLPEGKYKAELNFSELNSGIYFVRLYTNQNEYRTKIIKP